MRRERRQTRPISWLSAVQTATAAFTGQARLLEDQGITEEQTSFRGEGYRLTSDIIPQRSLFGPLPKAAVRLQGETQRAPDGRLVLDTLFPPDTLRQVAYWDSARSDAAQPVLVVLAEPAQVRLLAGPDDNLTAAVTLIHHWISLAKADIKSAVLADLAKPGHSPVAYLTGFELLTGAKTDLPGLFSLFVKLPGRPGPAIQGILDELYLVGASLSGPEIMALAWRIVEGWSQENDPAALSSYLLWFDAHRARTWLIDPKMRKSVAAEVKRAGALKFTGPDSEAWEQQVKRYAAGLLP
jgi:hypothetical protein